MFKVSYKLNDSYTTYVILNDEENESNKVGRYYWEPKKKNAQWKAGDKVNHIFHGEGKIERIMKNNIAVLFSHSKALCNKRVRVVFNYKHSPSEIDSLKLCC